MLSHWQQQQHPHQYPPQQQYPQHQYLQQQLNPAQHQYPPPQQNLQVVPLHRQPVQRYFLSKKQFRSVKGISICQIVTGCVSFIAGAYESGNDSFNGVLRTGIWAGIFMFATGIIGVIAAVKKNLCSIVACMIMNIICSLFAAVLVSLSSLSIHITSTDGCSRGQDNYSYYDSTTFSINSYSTSDDCADIGDLAADSVTLIVGLAQFVITIVCSAICCGVTCCGKELSTTNQLAVEHPMNQQFVGQPVLPQEGGRRYEPLIRPSDSGYTHLTPDVGVDNPPKLPAPRRLPLPATTIQPDNEYSYVELPPLQSPKVTISNDQQYFGAVDDSGYVADAQSPC